MSGKPRIGVTRVVNKNSRRVQTSAMLSMDYAITGKMSPEAIKTQRQNQDPREAQRKEHHGGAAERRVQRER